MPEPEICFVICPIGDEGTEIRNCSDIVLNEIISPVVSELGYKVMRADHLPHPGMITSQIIDMLVEAPLVIADLSDENPNVFYELAIRHVIGLPCIQLIKSGQKIPFDTSGMRTIQYELRVDLAHKAMEELQQQISSIKKGTYKPDNPVLSAKRYETIKSKLLSTDNAELRDLFAELMDTMKISMDEMRTEINELKQVDPRQNLQELDVVQGISNYQKMLDIERKMAIIQEGLEEYQNLEKDPSISDAERATASNRIASLQKQLKYLKTSRNRLVHGIRIG